MIRHLHSNVPRKVRATFIEYKTFDDDGKVVSSEVTDKNSLAKDYTTKKFIEAGLEPPQYNNSECMTNIDAYRTTEADCATTLSTIQSLGYDVTKPMTKQGKRKTKQTSETIVTEQPTENTNINTELNE